MQKMGNTEYPDNVDATTSASIVVDDAFRYSTTEDIANMIMGKGCSAGSNVLFE